MWKFWILGAKRKKAFLLVEVLLTIAILATVLTFVVRSFLTSLQAGKLSVDFLQAQLLLENNLSLLENEGTVADGLHSEEVFASPNEKFKFKLDSQNASAYGQTGGLNDVQAAVFWTAKNINRNISVSTYLKNKKNDEAK